MRLEENSPTPSTESSVESCPGPENDLQLSRNTALGISVDGEDLRYFEHFRHDAIRDLASFLDAHIWQYDILRIAASRPAVKHAILALSAQHESFLKIGHTDISRNMIITDPALIYSWKHYIQAIRNLHLRIQPETGDKNSNDETIITCLLLIFFEVLRGNYPAALMHLEAGLQIFATCCPAVERSLGISSRQDDLMEGLARIFKRLDIQASAYVDDRNVSTFSIPSCNIRSEPFVPPSWFQINMDFITIQDARDALHERVACVFYFMRSPARSLQGDPYFETRRVMDLKYDLELHTRKATPALAKITKERQHHLSDLRAWASAFEVLLERSATGSVQPKEAPQASFRGKEVEQCAVLWLSYLVNLTLLSNCLEPNETSWDECFSQFQGIVHHARSVLLTEGGKLKNSANRRLSLEMCVIYPLFVTAFKCRNPQVRRDALSLLHMSGQEGVWNGKMLATIAEHVMEFEESQGYVEVGMEQVSNVEVSSPISDPGLTVMDASKHNKADAVIIPEFARVHGVHPDFADPGTGSLWLEYSTRESIAAEIGHESELLVSSHEYKWVFHKVFIES